MTKKERVLNVIEILKKNIQMQFVHLIHQMHLNFW